jgi:hypothetical protein
MGSAIKVLDVDNRGSDTSPYGWVYFSDDTRVGFGSGDGPGTYGLFAGTWGPATDLHYTLAEQALTELLPDVVRNDMVSS